MPAPIHLLTGRKGERLACRFLMRQGFDILARRFRGHQGEIDLIAFEGTTLVFIEVKTRSSRDYGDPWEFVDWEKQQRFRLTAEEFIARYDIAQYAYRFDIVSVIWSETQPTEIALHRNAF
jgi:putative endonuclease